MRHKFMPISVSLKDRPCLVVGGGLVALRKVESLLDYDTAITVVAREAHEKLGYHAERGRITLERRDYESPEAGRYGLVISATELPSFELVPMETPTWVNELGAKGVGESGTIGAIPATYNAVIDALAPYGVRHLTMPCTPEKVWAALDSVRTS